MYLQQFFIEGLGCASYLVGCESAGVAAVVDPDRDVRPYLQVARERGLKITHIIETHLHADHVSGNLDLQAQTDATIYLAENSGATFAHTPLADGATLFLGNLRLLARHTPGHTPESLTLFVSDTTRGPEPWLALTGDTLFVGDAGRPDLTGAEAARGLASQMHTTLFEKILPNEDGLLIYPGHGAGSLCGKSIGSLKSTTLGYERKHNPALAPRSAAEFVEFAVSDLPEQPANHTRIKATNRAGARPMGTIQPRALTVQNALPHFQQGAALLDTRAKAEFVAKHIPGAVHLPADAQLSNRIGVVLPPQVPVVLLLEDVADYERVVYSLARVGYDQVLGYLAEDLAVWEALGLPVTSGDVQDIAPAELQRLLNAGNGQRPVVVDVREPWEFKQGHVPGARLIPLGQLQAHLKEFDPAQPIAVICASGSRSQNAAMMLGRRGFKTVYNVLGGTSAWQMARLPLER